MKTATRRSSARRVLDGVLALVAVAGVVLAGRALFDIVYYSNFVAATAAMQPTIKPFAHMRTRPVDGDEVHAGEIVVFRRTVYGRSGLAVMRVVAVGGQTVAEHAGQLWVDGRPASEPYLAPGTQTGTVKPLTVPRGEVYVLGDHREDEAGSDYLGPVSTSAIAQRVVDTDAPSGASEIAQLVGGTSAVAVAALLFWGSRRPARGASDGQIDLTDRQPSG